MADLIRNYSNKPSTELNDSIVYKTLENIINKAYDHHCHYIRSNKTFTELKKLLGEELTQERAIQILQPWIKAVRIASIIGKISLRKTREKYRRQIQHIEAIIKDLNNGIHPVEPLIFFLTGDEINHEIMIDALEAYKQHFSLILNLKFITGTPLNPDNIRMHGIFSLFHLGKKLGLKNKGKPTPLRKFVQIATNKEYKEIEKYHTKYNKKKFEKTTACNAVCRFIYNHQEPLPI